MKSTKKIIKQMIKDAESPSRDSAGRFTASGLGSFVIPGVSTHRGADITYTTGTSGGGTHLHAGDMAIPGWLNDRVKLLKEEEYERGKKEALKKLWDLVPHTGETAVLMNSGEWVGVMGLTSSSAESLSNQVLVHKDYLFPEGAGEEVPTIVSMAIDELEVGWYQDDKADLYYYEGEGHWKEVDLATNKKLTEDAILGKLEYIG